MNSIYPLIKTKIITVLGIILVFLFPIRGLLITVGLAIIVDTIIGIIKAKKAGGWQSVTSRKLSNIVSKMVLYELAVILFFCMDTFIMGDVLFEIFNIKMLLTRMIGALLCFIELKSINENVKIITGVSLWERFKEMITRSKEIKQDLSELTEEKDVNA